MKKHFQSPNPIFNIRRREEPVATDSVYLDTVAVDNGSTIGNGDVDQTNKFLNETSDQPSKAGVRMRSAEAISY